MAPVRDVVVTVPAVERLYCPHTGKKVEVHMLVRPGSIVFCAPAAFTLAEPVKGLDNLYRKASMRNGVTGTIGKDKAGRDLFTGKLLRLREHGNDMYSFAGGFNPRAACSSLEEFLYRFTMRDGVATMPEPQEFSAEKPAAHHQVHAHDTQVSQDTLDAAAKAVEASGKFEKKSMVTAGIQLKKGGKRK